MSPCRPRRSRNIMLGIIFWALLSIAFEGAGSAHAQNAGQVDLTARVGFDGYCKPDQWLPVHVEIANTGPDLEASVQLSYEKSAGGRSITEREIELPSASRKQFFLYIYLSGFNRDLQVSVFARGQLLKRTGLSLTCLAGENMIFGVLSDRVSTYDVLGDVKPLNGFVRVAQLEPVDLPDRAQAWQSLDALIFSNIDTSVLSPEQRGSLKSWIAAGGKLLVVGGSNWQSTAAGIKDLMPVDLNTTRNVHSLSALQAYARSSSPLEAESILATGRATQGSQVLVQQDGIPVLVQRPMGFGAVYYLAADPALQPLNDWDGMKDVYEHLLGSRSQLPSWAKGTWYDYRATQALSTIPELGLPSVFYLCGLLAVYIVIIGPLNYLVLRRMKRREFAWVTIPVLVVVFTSLSYGTGFFYRGVTPILNRLAVAQAWDGMDQAQARAAVGIYSPVRTKYDFEARDKFLLQPFGTADTNLQTSDNWRALQEDTNMVLPDVRMEIGAMKIVAMDGSLPALAVDHDLVITLSRLNPVLSGKITNQSSYLLKDAILVTPGDWARLGDIHPGETKPVNISLAMGSNGPEFYGLDSMSILNITYQDTQTNQEAARRSAFLDTLFPREYGINHGNWGIYLMGWVDQAVLPASLQHQRFKSIDTMLYIDMLSPTLKIEPGELRLPASMFAWESSAENATPYYAREVPTSGYMLRFQPAVPIFFRTVKSLGLDLTSNAPLGDLIASAWDYELKTWVRIPLTGSHIDIPEPSRYVGPDGEIKIRIVSNRSDYTEITSSNISLVVEP